MNSADPAAQLAQLLNEICLLEEELKAISLRDLKALEQHRRKLHRVQLEVAQYRKDWMPTSPTKW